MLMWIYLTVINNYNAPSFWDSVVNCAQLPQK